MYTSTPDPKKDRRLTGLMRWLVRAEDIVSEVIGHPVALIVALGLVIGWFLFLPGMDISNWYNILELAIALVTFILVFVLQSSQNRDTRALHEKLDEIIRSLPDLDSSKAGLEKKLKGRD